MNACNNLKALAVAAVALGLVGCATGPVKPTYVSPANYQSMSCNQLRSEFVRLGQYIENGVETPARNAIGVGFGLGAGGWGRGGWGIRPNISVNMGQSKNSNRSEISKLMGQQDAIAQAAQYKSCPVATASR